MGNIDENSLARLFRPLSRAFTHAIPAPTYSENSPEYFRSNPTYLTFKAPAVGQADRRIDDFTLGTHDIASAREFAI